MAEFFLVVPSLGSLSLLALLCGLLASISIIDARHGIIPDWANAAMALSGLLRASLHLGPSTIEAAAAAMFTFCAFASLLAIFKYYRGHAGMGLGDVKFLAAAATWTGFMGLPPMILIASISGLSFVLLRSLAGYPLSQSTRLPFGPHLAMGLAVVCFLSLFN
ncbi:MAG TPA: A24 family peptidase [Aestuariivirgaceae bacterium]